VQESLWAGRSYAHVVLPAPYLRDADVAWLDRVVCREPEWAPADRDRPGVRVSREWVGPDEDDELLLVVLGFYPVLATVGGSETRAARRVIERLVQEVEGAGGQLVGDRDLSGWIATLSDRWDQVLEAEEEIEQMQVWLEFAQCRNCKELTSRAAPSCRGCGHRFTGEERAEHDRRREQAQKAIEDARARHTAATGGWGLLPRGAA
jgi:hypothetical protein